MIMKHSQRQIPRERESGNSRILLFGLHATRKAKSETGGPLPTVETMAKVRKTQEAEGRCEVCDGPLASLVRW